MSPSVPSVSAIDNSKQVQPNRSNRDLFTSSGARLPRFIARPDEGLVRLYGPPDPVQHCLGTRGSWVNSKTGEVVSQRCRRNTCLHSTRHEVKRLEAAIVLAAPETMFRYSCVPTDWPAAQKKVNRLHEYLRRQGRAVQVAYAIEHNPTGAGCHVHGFMHGDPVDDILGLSLERAGLGTDHHLQDVTHAGRLGYVMKQATHSQRSLDTYLEVNGGTLLRTSQAFWRDGCDGPRLTRREAVQRGWRRLHPPDPCWARVAATMTDTSSATEATPTNCQASRQSTSGHNSSSAA